MVYLNNSNASVFPKLAHSLEQPLEVGWSQVKHWHIFMSELLGIKCELLEISSTLVLDNQPQSVCLAI